jgi:putative transposase
MRNTNFAPGEYYHIYNRGVHKQRIFHSQKDYARFLLTMFAFRGKIQFNYFTKLIGSQTNLIENVKKFNGLVWSAPKLVEIIAFCLMPNHYHLLLKEITEGGISKYMLRLGDSYTKTSNKKYDRTGHLFSGPFQSIHVDRNEYLIYLSRYIHQNPADLLKSAQKLEDYPWSSYPDYVSQNRWGEGLQSQVIFEQFSGPKDYRRYVDKKVEIEIANDYLLD